MSPITMTAFAFGALAVAISPHTKALRGEPEDQSLWPLAQKYKTIHRYSTLFTAQDVRRYLSTDQGRSQAIEWCKRTGVTRVFVESFRDNYQADRETLIVARDALRDAGLEVSGCITTTRVGRPSTGWKDVISCYTDRAAQERLKSIFEFTAGLFDEIMIDDFWFTDCACPECEAGRKSKNVTILGKPYPVSEDTWEDYRCEQLVRMSQDCILAPARRVNPKVKIIIKYPQWYDRFHERGYEVVRETADFDRIWVGTETRDYKDPRWGGTPQYEAYFIMRWLGGIGGAKCGGGWFDPYGTTPSTYVEQGRQTILGGARESLLFCYGSLQEGTGPRNVEALRAAMPELLEVAAQVRRRQIVGIAAYKPPNSHAENEQRAYDFVGMLGLPLVPCHEFPTRAPAAFFPIHSMKDGRIVERLNTFIQSGRVAMITDGLARALAGKVNLERSNVHILKVSGDPKSLLEMVEADINRLREPLLHSLGARFIAPNRVGLYLFRDRSWVIENFDDNPVNVELNGKQLQVPARGWRYNWAGRT